MEYLSVHTPTGLLKIKFNGKGSVPLALRGSYTSHSEVNKAIAAHLLKKGGKANVKK